MIVKFEDIVIDPILLGSTPSQQKLDMCRDYYEEHGFLDKKITVDQNLVLTNGYIRYVVLKETGYSGNIEVKMLKRSMPSTRYLFARHPNNEKLYVWKVPDQMTLPDNIKGKYIMVHSNKRKAFVIADHIETLSFCPTRYQTRSVASTIINGDWLPIFAQPKD